VSDLLLSYFCVVLGVIVLLIIVSIFCEVEIRTDKYDGWIYRWAKHIKCGAICGHKYESGRCIHCGKRKLWRTRNDN